MIKRTRIYMSGSTCPYYNLAVEEHLLHLVEDEECILYLWQNKHTVVIGRNQNALKECNTERLATDGGKLARRLSGGGSVYHDLGNLNFTFLIKERDYDVDRQLSVIIRALKDFGLNAEKTGRNDICIEQRKFSGNAFYRHKGRCYHHGTILVDVDLQDMSKYLHVSREKLRSKGVSSVKSRVVNLKDLSSSINISDLKSALVRAFAEIYTAEPESILDRDLDSLEIKKLEDKYASHEWLYGKRMKADLTLNQRYAWGEISIDLQIQGDIIADVQVFSDAMHETIAELMVSCLTGVRFQQGAMVDALRRLEGKVEQEVLDDIIALIKTQEIW
ncbi:MAG: lipoate--protein ligase [Peptococcaceae bacterium]|jgi:lipoate-protein ligase A|nr:lipoate--protein ligase [Peptococcaceae bacterium]